MLHDIKGGGNLKEFSALFNTVRKSFKLLLLEDFESVEPRVSCHLETEKSAKNAGKNKRNPQTKVTDFFKKS